MQLVVKPNSHRRPDETPSSRQRRFCERIRRQSWLSL